ncbi:MAG TPA: rhomboid family intramembrane serine protease [Allosphingosinicella sp.]|nr:rhomboid family intramembrane serine protease [Allosphingosinicella sp.]
MSYTDPEPVEDDLFPEEGWDVPWHSYVLPVLLAAGMTGAWLLHFPRGMTAWAVSGAALADGHYATIALHMVAHGPLVHIAMNMAALFVIGGRLMTRLGVAPASWLRFLALFALSGLAGAACYLAVHPQGAMPMLGASGALYGLLGLLVRLPPEPGQLPSLRTARMRRVAIRLIMDNVWLFALLVLPSLLLRGEAMGLAWEAHLGGFLLGLLAGPLFLPSSAHAQIVSAAPEGAS